MKVEEERDAAQETLKTVNAQLSEALDLGSLLDSQLSETNEVLRAEREARAAAEADTTKTQTALEEARETIEAQSKDIAELTSDLEARTASLTVATADLDIATGIARTATYQLEVMCPQLSAAAGEIVVLHRPSNWSPPAQEQETEESSGEAHVPKMVSAAPANDSSDDDQDEDSSNDESSDEEDSESEVDSSADVSAVVGPSPLLSPDDEIFGGGGSSIFGDSSGGFDFFEEAPAPEHAAPTDGEHQKAVAAQNKEIKMQQKEERRRERAEAKAVRAAIRESKRTAHAEAKASRDSTKANAATAEPKPPNGASEAGAALNKALQLAQRRVSGLTAELQMAISRAAQAVADMNESEAQSAMVRDRS